MTNEVQIRWERLSRRKGEAEVRQNKVTYRPSDVLLGDGKATVERTRYAKHGIGYGDFAISGSCTVSLSCNQDDKTIIEACKKAGQIADAVMKQDDEKMVRIVEAVAKELEKHA